MGAELKFAGFDAIIIRGIAERPVYLWVHDGKYELRDATYLWGLSCSDTHTLIREELGDPRIRIACIGPAGEQSVRYSGIFSDRRAAGRGGGGMGAKKLKAIAATGVEDFASTDYLWRVGERIFNLERMFNVREGFSSKDDVFPLRFTKEPLPEGGSVGQVFEVKTLLSDYYKARGWDIKTGIPLLASLTNLAWTLL